MIKKFSLLLGSMALIAFALPAFAGAHAITTTPGVLAPVGSTVLATSVNVETTGTPIGTVRCEHVTFSGIITKNNGTEFDISDDAPGTAKCVASGLPVTTSMTLTTLVGGPKPGTTFVTLDYSEEISTVLCEYTNASATSIPFTYAAGTDTIHIAGKVKDPKRAVCLEPEIHGDFTLTIGGKPVILD